MAKAAIIGKGVYRIIEFLKFSVLSTNQRTNHHATP